MIHCGAIIGGMLSMVFSKFQFSRYLWDMETMHMISAGSAAGVAAAFGAPIGGVIFAMEEGVSHWSVKVMIRTFVSTCSAAFVLYFFRNGTQGWTSILKPDCCGNWGRLDMPMYLQFGPFGQEMDGAVHGYTLVGMPVFVLVGVLGGLIGALFNHLNEKLTIWRMKYIGSTGLRRYLEALFLCAVVTIWFWIVPLATGHCLFSEVEKDSFEKNIVCTDGAGVDQTSDDLQAIGLFRAEWGKAVGHMFHHRGSVNPLQLTLFLVMYLLAACWTYGAGMPSGLFIPSMLSGAVLGRIVGEILKYGDPSVHAGRYALVGASAMLGGMARITVSLSVILIETTGNVEWILPVMLTTGVAKATGALFNPGIYDIHIELSRKPLLEAYEDTRMRYHHVEEVMTQHVQFYERKAKVSDVLNRLLHSKHNAFPTVECGTLQFCGMIKRSVLLQILSTGAEQNLFANSTGGDIAIIPYKKLSDSSVPDVTTLASQLDHVKDVVFDLSPYIDEGVYVIQARATLRRAYRLFRLVGLRHLPVVTQDNTLVGIITRTNLIVDHEGHGGHGGH